MADKNQDGFGMHAKLIAMRDQAGYKHYDRIALADKLLGVREWVEAADGGGGDLSTAYDRLERDAFGDLCGMMSMGQLLEVLKNVPNVEDWRKHKFDLKKIWGEWKAKQEAKKAKPQTNGHQPRERTEYTTPLEFVHLTSARQTKEYERVYKAEESLADKLAKALDENERLKAEVVQLRTELKEFRDLGKRFFAARTA